MARKPGKLTLVGAGSGRPHEPKEDQELQWWIEFSMELDKRIAEQEQPRWISLQSAAYHVDRWLLGDAAYSDLIPPANSRAGVQRRVAGIYMERLLLDALADRRIRSRGMVHPAASLADPPRLAMLNPGWWSCTAPGHTIDATCFENRPFHLVGWGRSEIARCILADTKSSSSVYTLITDDDLDPECSVRMSSLTVLAAASNVEVRYEDLAKMFPLSKPDAAAVLAEQAGKRVGRRPDLKLRADVMRALKAEVAASYGSENKFLGKIAGAVSADGGPALDNTQMRRLTGFSSSGDDPLSPKGVLSQLPSKSEKSKPDGHQT